MFYKKKVIQHTEDFRQAVQDGTVELGIEKVVQIDDMTPEQAYVLGTKDTLDAVLKYLKTTK